MPLLRRNLELNGLAGPACTAQELRWGSPLPPEWPSFDVVLAADVVYPTKDPAVLLALRDTILALCPLGSPTLLLLGDSWMRLGGQLDSRAAMTWSRPRV